MPTSLNFSSSLSSDLIAPFEISRLTLLVPGLPASLSGYTIAQITDLHYGPCTSLGHLRRAIDLVAKEEPNAVFLTGDYIQLSNTGFKLFAARKVNPRKFGWAEYRRKVRRHAAELGELFLKLSPPAGTFAVFGNHDYSEGITSIKRQFPKKVTWLKNEHAIIEHQGERILLLGLDDTRFGKPSLKDALSGVKEKTSLSIVLAHNPDILTPDILPQAELKELGARKLILSGHTHGGQICWRKNRPIISRTSQRKHITGLSRFENSLVYVNRGLGYGALPIRLFCDPEILIIRLEAT